MRNLLVTDFKRILKDKLLLIVCIIGLAFALSTPLLYKVIFSSVDLEGMDDLLALYMSAKPMLFTSFSLTNNFGMILPIFIMIIVCKDFSQGTIRNKIISGHSRTKVFLSTFITCAVIMCTTILLYALIQFFVSLIFFEYSPTGFENGELGYLIKSLALDMLIYIFISALLAFLCVFMKNVGVSIVTYFGIIFLMLGFYTVLSVAIIFLVQFNEQAANLCQFLLDINIVYNVTIIGTVTYEKYQILKILISTIIYISLFVFFGILTFNKKDLK